MLFGILVAYFFFMVEKDLLYEYIIICLSILLLMDFLGCFQFGAIINKAIIAMNIHRQVLCECKF